MKIKQTLILVAMTLATVAGSFFISQPVLAASCAGVDTSIIDCEETGMCTSGEDPYEGPDPGDDTSRKDAYKANYGHYYGKCNDGTDPKDEITSSGIWGIVLLVINILTAGIGIVAVGGIIYGSVLYASAGGAADNVKKAKGIITNIVIGLAAYALMYSLLNFIIPGGIFS